MLRPGMAAGGWRRRRGLLCRRGEFGGSDDGQFDVAGAEGRGFTVGEAQSPGLDAEFGERRQHGAESEGLVVGVSAHREHRPIRELAFW